MSLSRTHRPVAPSSHPSTPSSASTSRAQLPPKLVNSNCYFLKRLNLETLGRSCLPQRGPRKLAPRSPGKESRTAKINRRDQPDTLHVAARRAEPARGAGAGRAWGPAASACRRTARAQGRSGSRADKTRRAAPTRPALLHQSQPASKHPAPRRAAPHTMGSAARSPRPGPLRAAGEITLWCNPAFVSRATPLNCC